MFLPQHRLWWSSAVNRRMRMLGAPDRAEPKMNGPKVEEAPPSPDARSDRGRGVAVETVNMTTPAPFALIIDDQEDICRFVAMVLADLGVESAAYTTAKSALASLDQRRPDLIFLDVALEQSDAIDVIKGLSEKRYTGIIQLMSGARVLLLEAMQRIGARYGLVLRPALQKPVRGEDIRRAIAGMGLAGLGQSSS
jgi:CheY-like chemotaxis protein